MDGAPPSPDTARMRLVTFGMRALVLAGGVGSGVVLASAYLLG